MSDYELGDGLAAGVGPRLGAQMGDEAVRHPVEDRDRSAVPGEPPVPGAQWDELHNRWEHWDEDAEAWVVVGDDAGDGVAPEEENPLPSFLSRVTHEADELVAQPAVANEHRQAEPGEGPAGAQWNEVLGRWERWDEQANDWVAVL